MSDLKTCPFCGSENIDSAFVRGYANGDRKQPIVATGCNDCGAVGPVVRVPDNRTGYAESAEKWNTRTLMGGGELVGFRYRANGHSEWVTVFGRSPDSYELREFEIEALYTRPQA